jgi:solute carrier family 66, member 2
MLAPIRPIYGLYSVTIGYIGLSVEATLPIPQIMANMRSRSCKGFRFSVLAFWLMGDAMKMFWFFTSPTEIPWAFKLCGIFQALCDAFLGLQYLLYGNGDIPVKQYPISQFNPGTYKPRIASGRATPTGRRTPVHEKDYR